MAEGRHQVRSSWVAVALCAGALAVTAQAVDHAAGAVVSVDSAANGSAEDAVGPLARGDVYVGAWVGADTEDWLHYWHHPAWHGPISYSSQCPARVELHSSVGDALTPGELLSQFEIGPEKMTQGYATSEPVMRRMLVRLVRTDAGPSQCLWTAEPESRTNGFGVNPPTPRLTLSVEKRGGRAVAVVVRARIQGGTQRSAQLHISGIVQRTIDVALIPRSGTITRRIDLPAGRRGSVRVRVSVPAIAQKPAMPEVSRSVTVSTTPSVRRPKPAVRRPKPVTRAPRGPLTRVPWSIFYFRERPAVRPRAIDLAQSFCTGFFRNIRWTSWGSATATGSGIRYEPRYADWSTGCGDTKSFRTTIRLLKPKRCAGVRIFTRVKWKGDGRWHHLDTMDCPPSRRAR